MRAPRTINSICSIPQCDRKLAAHGLCDTHGYRLRKHGSPLAHIPVGKSHWKTDNGICSRKNCERPALPHGLCEAHRAASYHPIYRQRALELLGGKCSRCGFSDPRALQIDHINGGGVQEHKRLGGRRITKKVAEGYTEGYQLLCANCNWIKRVENGEHN